MKKSLLTIVSIVIAIAVAACMLTVFVACDKPANNNNGGEEGAQLAALNVNGVVSSTALSSEDAGSPKAKESVKIGLICLHDENSTYDKNFIDAMNSLAAHEGLAVSQVLIETGVPEGNECYTTACDLADQGCDIIFADSFGHEDYMIQAARRYPNVQFCHATGTQAHTAGLANFHNAFASIYEGRYLAGVAAGLKLQAMIAADPNLVPKVGYIGAFTYAEVISGYTSWFLGVRSVVPEATMEVTFTGSWYDETAENSAAVNLINRGCVLISQHADSMGAPNACEAAGVPDVSYNGSTAEACPNTFIVSSRIDWEPYYKYCLDSVVAGKKIATDWVGTIATGSVKLTELGNIAPAGTQQTLETVSAQLQAGTLKVFNTANFTVNGQHLTECAADVDSDEAFEHETNAIVGGIFLESVGRSAPYFDITIDGITLLDTRF